MEPKNTSTPQVPNFDGEIMKVPPTMQPVATTSANQPILSGPIIFLLVGILLAMLGGIYYWYTILMSTPLPTTTTRPTAEMNNEPESTTMEARTAATDIVSTSDDIEAIQADIESVQFADIDDGFIAIESELSAALAAPTTP